MLLHVVALLLSVSAAGLEVSEFLIQLNQQDSVTSHYLPLELVKVFLNFICFNSKSC